MPALTAYQQLRKANLGENSQVLAKHGLLPPVVEQTSVVRQESPKKVKVIKRIPKPLTPSESAEPRRFSLRVCLKPRVTEIDGLEDWYDSLSDSGSDSDYDYREKVKTKKQNDIPEVLLKYLRKPSKPLIQRPNTYGSINGVHVGHWWETRIDCNYDGIHRPTVAGIHPGPDGAYSVALSGGYEDDVDLGDSFTYTGEGGRDLKGTKANPKNLRTAPQSKDQALVRGNLALSQNAELGTPVRVIRGYKLSSSFAPERGYRYDGLYKVTNYWQATGQSGFKVYKFTFERCDAEPAPWHQSFDKTPFIEEPDTKEEPWCGWPPEVSVPRTDILQIECEGKIERLQLVGDDWFFLNGDQEPLSPCHLRNQDQEVHDNLEGGWCGWPPQVCVSGTDILHIEYDGNIERVKLVGDEWQIVSRNQSTGSHSKHHDLGSTSELERD